MQASRLIAVRAVLMFALAACLSAGCKPAGAPAEESRISKLGTYYGRYIAANKGKTPGSEAEFKKFIKGLDADANVDELFTSPRDSQAYMVRYGIPAGMPGSKVVAVYERNAIDGKRMVAMSTGEMQTVDEAEFMKLVPQK